MKWTNFILAAVISSTALAKGILPCMVYRYGLTNEQMDDLLARHPNGTLRITAQDWRAMRYQLHRFDCMTNYVNIIGSTQDCARVLLDLHDQTVTLVKATNAFARVRRELESQRDTAAERANEYAEAYADATNRIAFIYADYTSATNRAARADRLKAWLEEQRDKQVTSAMKKIYQAIIDKLDERLEGN